MKKRNQLKKIMGRLLSGILLTVMVFTLALNLLVPDRKNSAVENRPLQQFPAPTLSALADGSFTKDWDDWFTDQFVFRDRYINMGYILKRVQGFREINDVYIGKKQLIQKAKPYNESIVQKNADAIARFAQQSGIPAHVMVVPTAAIVDSSALPRHVRPADMAPLQDRLHQTLEGKADVIDLLPDFSKRQKEDLYYRTDHHWTSLGAFYGFEAFAAACGIDTSIGEFEQMKVSTTFQGTLSSKTGDPFLKDPIDIFVYRNMPDYVMTRDNKDASRTMYVEKALDQKDQYQVFTGTNTGLLRIETTNDSTRRLIIFKDSYANSMLQFLIPYYRTITVVDPRYYYEDLNVLLRQDMPTEALFLYNYDNFVSDSNLEAVMSVFAAQIESES